MKKTYISILFFFNFLFISCDDFESTTLEKPKFTTTIDLNDLPTISKEVDYNKLNIAGPQNLLYDDLNSTVNILSLKDTVVVYVDGGPQHTRTEQEQISDIKGLLSSEGLINHSFVVMKQMHNVNPTVFGSGLRFSNDNAEEVNNQTLDMIESITKLLKNNGKIVYLFGHSNGGYMVSNYLLSNREAPNYFIIAGSRLVKIPENIDSYPNFIGVNFIDGLTPTLMSVPNQGRPYFNVLSKLQLNHEKDYVNLLSNNPKLAKTFFSMSFKDVNVGQINATEQVFINSNSPHIFLPNGSHDDSFAFGLVLGLQHFRN